MTLGIKEKEINSTELDVKSNNIIDFAYNT